MYSLAQVQTQMQFLHKVCSVAASLILSLDANLDHSGLTVTVRSMSLIDRTQYFCNNIDD